MKTVQRFLILTCSVALLASTRPAAAGHAAPERVTFQKCFVPDGGPFGGHLEGTVTGDCGAGTVVFHYLSITPGKAIWKFSGEYIVSAADCSFTAVCTGTIDVRSGHVVLNGVVTEGANPGTHVQVRAQANADLSCSEGTITVKAD